MISFPKPEKKVKVKKRLNSKGKSTLSSSKRKAWAAFSLYIRKRAADDYGMVKCVTCPNKKHYSEMQAGHFIPGRNNAVLFSEDGVHPQCYGCNIGKGGNWPAYYEYMLKMYGQEIIDQLLNERHKVIKYTKADYEALAGLYKEFLEDL